MEQAPGYLSIGHGENLMASFSEELYQHFAHVRVGIGNQYVSHILSLGILLLRYTTVPQFDSRTDVLPPPCRQDTSLHTISPSRD
jgi:hypothetical protein